MQKILLILTSLVSWIMAKEKKEKEEEYETLCVACTDKPIVMKKDKCKEKCKDLCGCTPNPKLSEKPKPKPQPKECCNDPGTHIVIEPFKMMKNKSK